jgi:hypothetical protein
VACLLAVAVRAHSHVNQDEGGHMTDNIILPLKRKPLPSKEDINYAVIKVLTDAALFKLLLPILSRAPITKAPGGFELGRHIHSFGDGFVLSFMEALVVAVNRANDDLWD